MMSLHGMRISVRLYTGLVNLTGSYALVWYASSGFIKCAFGLAGQGAQCRTRTDERTNAPMNHARRIMVNGPRMQRQSGLTLWKNRVRFGNRAMSHANARCTDKPRPTYQGARSSYAKTKPLEPGHQNAFKLV